MKFFYLSFCSIALFLIVGKSYAQKTKIDSLKKAITTSKSDSNKVNMLNQLAYEFVIDQPDQAKLNAEKALELANQLHFSAAAHTSKQYIILANRYLDKQANFRTLAILMMFLMGGLAYLFFKNQRNQMRGEIDAAGLMADLDALRMELHEKEEELKQQREEFDALHSDLDSKIKDRTIELQSAAENLIQRNKDLEEFSYIVSHNLRAPVANMLGLASLFKRTELSEEQHKELVPHLEDSAKRLDTTIRDLNEVLSIRNSAMKNREHINLADTLGFIEKSLKNEIYENKVEIETDFSKTPILYTVRGYLESILYNLLSNAIKYRSPERFPHISLSTHTENDYDCLIVSDNGLGIDLKTGTYKIFGLYQRMHTHTEGKGFGLYLVQTQVESLNGKIEVESEIGQGTTFKVYLKK
ncbi:MAG: sensor histidine kinase [Cytophagales bacterium]|nr:MAG: sensor histidine kinase [Cytophagales bacterium]